MGFNHQRCWYAFGQFIIRLDHHLTTAADFLRVGNALTGFCLDLECGHSADVDLTALKPATVLTGPDRASMRCTACGGRKVKRIVSPLGAKGYWRRVT